MQLSPQWGGRFRAESQHFATFPFYFAQMCKMYCLKIGTRTINDKTMVKKKHSPFLGGGGGGGVSGKLD